MKPKIDPEIANKIEWMMAEDIDHIGKHLGMEIISIKKDELIARLPVDGRTVQPFGLLHGGASVVLAESLSSVGAWCNIDSSQMALGIEINANHIKAMRSGWVYGKATPIYIGRTTHVWECRIETETGELVSITRCTLAIVKRR